MKKLTLILGLVVLCFPAASWAQLFPPNDKGVTMGHVHLIVRDLEASKKFWTMMGGIPLRIDGTDVMKFHGAFVFLTPGNARAASAPPKELNVICGCPSDGLEPSVLNHLGFTVQDLDAFKAKFKAAGLTMKEIPGAVPFQLGDTTQRRQVLVFGPDNVSLEVAEGKTVDFPVTRLHLHFFAPAFVPEYPHRVPAKSMAEWYSTLLGGTLLAANVGDEFPGVNMRISSTLLPTVPTKGSTVDHIGFEVTNLEAFSKKLEANKVKLDKPYSKSRHDGFASVELTDPYGVTVELTEGLNKF